jgi:signal transduction histidine kinase
MTDPPRAPTVPCVRTPPHVELRERFHPLSVFGFVALSFIVLASITTEPHPGLSGDGPLVALGLVVLVVGIAMTLPPRQVPDRVRIVWLLVTAAAMVGLTILQPQSAHVGIAYYIVIVAAIRLDTVPGIVVSAVVVAAECITLGFVADEPAGAIIGVVASIVPWFLVMRLVGQLHAGREQAEELIEELRESRAAATESAALAERGRVARDMHDVLAHSLSALALQLEGTRLLARDRGADPEIVDAVERAHRLAGEGLAEARDAIAALRGEELPGPERLEHLAEAFAGDARVTVCGTPRELESEARLAIYRTAQEALTNVLRHSAAERVEVRLEYAADGVRLGVQDFGPGAPVAVGPGSPGGGYGLTGMRERAELLGGRLSAAPTDDGFRVELWLPQR